MVLSHIKRVPAKARGCPRPAAGVGLCALIIVLLLGAAAVLSGPLDAPGAMTAEVWGYDNSTALVGVVSMGAGLGWPKIGAAGMAALDTESEPTESESLAIRNSKPAFLSLSTAFRNPWPTFPAEGRSTPLYLRHQSLLC